MKKATKARGTSTAALRSSYDFAGGERGKYVSRYRNVSNVVILEPDVARAFRSSQAVNRALRAVLKQRTRRSS